MGYYHVMWATNKKESPSWKDIQSKRTPGFLEWKNSVPMTMAILLATKPVSIVEQHESILDDESEAEKGYMVISDLKAGFQILNKFLTILKQKAPESKYLQGEDSSGRSFSAAADDFLKYMSKYAKKYRYLAFSDGYMGISGDNLTDVKNTVAACSNFQKRFMIPIMKNPDVISKYKNYFYEAGTDTRNWEWSIGLPYAYDLRESTIHLNNIPKRILFESCIQYD